VQIAVLPSHVVCLSVCDVGRLWSHWLEILETNCTYNYPNTFTHHSPKAIHLFPGELWEILGWQGGVGKSGMLEHKSGYPLISQEWVKLQTSNLAGAFMESIRTKAHQKFWRKGSLGVSRDCPNFWVPPIISGTGKVTDFRFCTHIHSVSRNKSPWKMLGKVVVGAVNESRKFSGHPYIGRIAQSSLR